MTEPLRGNTTKAQDFGSVSTKQQWIAELAKERPQTAFTSLAHLIDLDWLKEAYRRTRKDGAIGVDGTTAEQYEANLEGNLQSLLERAKSGRYQAPPVRRVHIPKGNGETRPLGIPTLEDKVLQRAVLMILEPLYETAFLDVSFGFRPGKSAHQALAALWKGVMGLGSVWIADVDLRKYFDTIDHGHLREFLKRRVRDGVLLRLIGKWLNAGVLEEGEVTYPEKGTPQGGVITHIPHPPRAVNRDKMEAFRHSWRAREVDSIVTECQAWMPPHGSIPRSSVPCR
jgi:RNA-directed DNA polymerase